MTVIDLCLLLCLYSYKSNCQEIQTSPSMKNISQLTCSLELALLENVFQKFCNFTYKYLRLSNFFWAVASTILTALAMINVCYQGIAVEHDPFIVFPAFIAVVGFFPSISYSIKKAYFQSYDEMTYGLENSLKESDRCTRANTFMVCIIATLMWSLIAFKSKDLNLKVLILWISMTNYPTYSFCACNPPGQIFK